MIYWRVWLKSCVEFSNYLKGNYNFRLCWVFKFRSLLNQIMMIYHVVVILRLACAPSYVQVYLSSVFARQNVVRKIHAAYEWNTTSNFFVNLLTKKSMKSAGNVISRPHRGKKAKKANNCNILLEASQIVIPFSLFATSSCKTLSRPYLAFFWRFSKFLFSTNRKI